MSAPSLDAKPAPTTLESLEPQLRAQVRRLCPGWLRSQEDDLVQAGLIKLSHTLERGRAVNKTYVKRVAWSVTVDAIRRARRTADHPTPDGEEGLAGLTGGRSPEDSAALGELRKALRACLEALSAVQRDPLTLYLLGHTLRETASLLGISNKQADNRIYRGLPTLRDCLTKKGITP